MNRRQFIKAAVPAAAIPAIAITCKYEDDEKGPEKESKNYDWPYRVYCYERGQGQWVFSHNTRGSFAPEREYMTFEEDKGWPYAGWMIEGVLHFQTFDDATDFVDMHVRAKDDINLIDSIYDIYRKSTRHPESAHPESAHPDTAEIHVAHYWFNGDTGNQIHWEADGFNTDLNKIESS